MSAYYLIPVPLFALASYSSLSDNSAAHAYGGIPLTEYLGVYATALVVAYASILFFVRHADKLGLLDHPDGDRKIHKVVKPLVGGISVISGVLISILLFVPAMQYIGLMISILMLLAIGVLDDRQDLSFKIRFGVQFAATVVTMIIGDTVLSSFGDLLGFGKIGTGALAHAVTIFCAIGVINAVNMIDGLDGLAGGISLVAFSTFAMLAWLNGQPDLMLISIAFVGALAAFLHFNWFPSKLFMGDAGSMTLGFVLAYLAIETTQKPGSIVSPVAALLVLALPVTDTLTVMFKRVLKRKNPFQPDKTHLHHQLKATGIDHHIVVILMITATIISSTIAVAGTILEIPDHHLFGIYMFGFISYFAATYNINGIYRRLTKLRKQKVQHADLEEVMR